PVEMQVQPGDTHPLQVRLYNEKGAYLGTAKELNKKIQFEVEGVGKVVDGEYIAPAKTVTDAALLTASLGDVTGTARVRVIPPFSWSYDFDNGEIPVTWVGIRYRHIPIDFELLQALKAQNPMASELYIFLMSSFINSGLPAAKYDDSTPRKGWTDFTTFMKMSEVAGDLQQSKAKIDPLLEILKDKGVVKGWSWENWNNGSLKGIRLTVQRGPRKISEGNGVMMKITTIPKGMRSQGWMGTIDAHDYTIEADIYASEKDGRLPDIGLVGQRYTLDLMGASQQLQIRTWTPQLRMAQTVPYEWKPRVWYRLKFRTEAQDGKAVLKGKVWERGKPEPAEWTVTAEDPSPNLTGSPGTYGNAKDAELFYDNIKVYENSDG
ncbi:MAG: pyrrolo-quinoline quinone, partial [Planctomycetaceae bacterium]|nr:pyrrolo-quinoline quinone [Planctomycetaceae bacterium]